MDNTLLIYSGIGGFLFFAALMSFVYFRGLALLQFYQQEEYDTDRFLKWVVRKRGVDKKATLIVLSAYIAWYLLEEYNPPLIGLFYYASLLGGLVIGSLSSRGVMQRAKKPLVQTKRVQRILFVFILLVGIYFASILVLFQVGNYMALTFSFMFFFQTPPLFIAVANFILKPVEEWINNRYLQEALKKLEGLNPTIIGITGSYGKTSIKHILAHILGATAPTLATPGSVNTPMGIVRIVRENLEKKHKFFVVEMGAYGPGSIERLCKITPPHLGIISAVGYAHFERFKSLRTVFKTKFELASDVGERGGKTIVNSAAVDAERLAAYQKTHKNLILCEGDSDFALNSYTQTREGLDISMHVICKGKEQNIEVKVPLFGPHQATNILLATVAALELGIAPDVIKAALKTMPQIPHRLEVTKAKQGPKIIDDAYNSNPSGFSNALDLLETLTQPGGKAYLLTPGMVELGVEHNSQHKKLAKKAARIVDYALIVGPNRMAAFIDAFQEVPKKKGVLHTFKNQDLAEKWVFKTAGPEDVILIENNLPDIYEADITF